ncbi:hypothetical protein BKA63DRAFT_429780 [Paraphoma chrysanthemicola]|nr:hypothetical protein BKA63DRAFT_430197 [Paraphoma chrysanthemicola]KAH7061825.1 hypothetical protein BKA63DRAFT_429780 [Paraphoma chrysanthemicola]
MVATVTLLNAPILASSTIQASASTAIAATTAPPPSLSDNSAIPSSTKSVSIPPKVHLVQVGAGGFQFEPAQLNNVSVGDVVTFEFYPPDHSVARAEYGKACMPYEYTGKDKTGFWSGTQWVDTITHWNLTINSTEPIFYYCAAPDSCREQRMVGAINPNGTQTLDAQIRAARSADIRIAPGDPVPKEIESSVSYETPALATSSPSHVSAERHPSKLPGGAIAGIVIGGIVCLVVCAGVLVWVSRSKAATASKQPGEHVATPDKVPASKGTSYQQMVSPMSPYSPQTFGDPTIAWSVLSAKKTARYGR